MQLWRLFIGLACGIATAASSAQDLPRGWRPLASSDQAISEDRVRLSMVGTEGDFDGDGKMDRGAILARIGNPDRAAVFVFLSNGGSPRAPTKLDEYKASSGEFMLSSVPQGCYRGRKRTLCLSNGGLARLEIEFGWGTLHWLEGGRWRQTKFSRGEFAGL